jgi:hypothetical protein
MDCPKGMKHEDNECLMLQKTIYGLVQSAKQWYKKLVTCLQKLGFRLSKIDSCLMIQNNKDGIVFICLYVDDCYAVGKTHTLDQLVKDICTKGGYKVKVEDNLSDYLSCNIVFNKNKKRAWLGQPHLIKSLQEKFGERVSKMIRYKTPGTPGGRMIRPSQEDQDNGILVNEDDHSLYQTGVGMLLYLVKHSRPDIANVVQELTKVLDGPTPTAM